MPFDLIPIEDTPKPQGTFDLVPVDDEPEALSANRRQAQTAPIFERGGAFDQLANSDVARAAINNPVGRFTAGLGAGISERFAGAGQAVADFLGDKATSQYIADRGTKMEADASRLGVVGKVGEFVGDVGASIAGGPIASGVIEGVTRLDTSGQGDAVDRGIQGTIGGAIGGAFVGGSKAIKALRGGGGAGGASADEVAKLANQEYQRAEKAGGILRSSVTDRFIDEATKRLNPQTEAGKLIAGDSVSTKLAERLQGLRGKPITLKAAQEIDEELGNVIDGLTDTGRLTKEGRKVLELQTTFRQTIEKTLPAEIEGGKAGFMALKEGRKLWSQAAQLRDIEKIILRGELSDNPASAIKAGFKALATNPVRMRGYNAETQKLIRKAAESGVVGDTLRVASSRLIPIVAGSTGNIGGAIAAQAGTTAARGAASRLQTNRALKVAESITKGTAADAPRAPSLDTLSRLGPAATSEGVKLNSRAEPVIGASLLGGGYAALNPQSPEPRVQTGDGFEQAPAEPMGRQVKPQASFDRQSYLRNIAKAEGKGKNPKSTAQGLGQFTNPTWIAEVKRQDPERAARLNARQLLELRKDPAYASRIFDGFTEKNARILSDAGLPVTNGSVYLAHFAGDTGAKNLLKADARKLVSAVLSKDAIAANDFLKGVRVHDLVAAAEVAGRTGRPLAQILKSQRRA